MVRPSRLCTSTKSRTIHEIGAIGALATRSASRSRSHMRPKFAAVHRAAKTVARQCQTQRLMECTQRRRTFGAKQDEGIDAGAVPEALRTIERNLERRCGNILRGGMCAFDDQIRQAVPVAEMEQRDMQMFRPDQRAFEIAGTLEVFRQRVNARSRRRIRQAGQKQAISLGRAEFPARCGFGLHSPRNIARTVKSVSDVDRLGSRSYSTY